MPDYTALRYFAALIYPFPSHGMGIVYGENEKPIQWATQEEAHAATCTLFRPGEESRWAIYDKRTLTPVLMYEWRVRPNVPHIMMDSEQVMNTFPDSVQSRMMDILEDQSSIIALVYSLDGAVYAWSEGERLEDVAEFFSEIGHDAAGNPCVNEESALAVINREAEPNKKFSSEDAAHWVHVLGYRCGNGSEENAKYDWSVYLPPMASERTHELVQIPLE